MTEACAEIVRRDDPRLYKTALFAPEPARSRLMVVYAFDIELSRATRASAESLIPRMRLQWWRDVVEDARAGGTPKAHDVAGPLAGLLADPGLSSAPDWAGLVDAHEHFLTARGSAQANAHWRAHRHQSLIALAGLVLSGAQTPMPPAGPAWADAFALRHAARMSADGQAVLIPDLRGSSLSAMARGDLTDDARRIIREVAERGLGALETARGIPTDRRTLPALLPNLWAERTLRMVVKDPAAIFGQLDDIDRPFDGLRLAWRALRGRW